MKKISLFIILLLLVSCTTSPTGRKQLMLVSPEQAIHASAIAYTQTLASFQKKGLLDSNVWVLKRVRNITGRLVAQAIALYPHTRNWQWTVRVIDDPKMVNAWCMAGGKMALYTGLLERVQPSDDELAQVIGHEISHALANHTAERMSMALATQVGMMGVAAATKESKYSQLALSGSSLAAVLAIQLPNSRTAEREADRMGIELAARAGYNPYAAATLWEKMAKVGGTNPPQFLSTHPSPENRQHTLQKLAAQMMPYYLDKRQRPVYPLRSL